MTHIDFNIIYYLIKQVNDWIKLAWTKIYTTNIPQRRLMAQRDWQGLDMLSAIQNNETLWNRTSNLCGIILISLKEDSFTLDFLLFQMYCFSSTINLISNLYNSLIIPFEHVKLCFFICIFNINWRLNFSKSVTNNSLTFTWRFMVECEIWLPVYHWGQMSLYVPIVWHWFWRVTNRFAFYDSCGKKVSTVKLKPSRLFCQNARKSVSNACNYTMYMTCIIYNLIP